MDEPMMKCPICHGTGVEDGRLVTTDPAPPGPCSICQGRGEIKESLLGVAMQVKIFEKLEEFEERMRALFQLILSREGKW